MDSDDLRICKAATWLNIAGYILRKNFPLVGVSYLAVADGPRSSRHENWSHPTLIAGPFSSPSQHHGDSVFPFHHVASLSTSSLETKEQV
jgi:hypothetical protein